MASKLAALSSKPVIREYASGAAQDAASKLRVAAFLAPTVQVASVAGKYKVYDQKNRFRIPNTRRATGGRATDVGFSATDADYNLNTNALDFPVDEIEKLEGDDLENVVKEGADMCAEVAALSHEKETVDAALAALGAGTNVALGANDNVIKILDGHILTVMKAAKYGSLMGVRVLFGASAWKIIKNHASVIGKLTSNGRGKGSVKEDLQATEAALTDMLIGRPEILTTYSVHDTAPEGLDESIDFILDTSVIVFACKPNPTRRDPSFMKTFALRGQFMKMGSYVRDDGRVEVAKFDWLTKPAVTNADAGIRLNFSEA